MLKASYEATLWAAVINAERHGWKAGSNKVFLTFLGGGVFGNNHDWIAEAMDEACDEVKDYALEVCLVVRGDVPQQYEGLLKRWK